jgi:hypothetical protein
MARYEEHIGEDHYPMAGSDAICSDLANNSPRNLLKVGV